MPSKNKEINRKNQRAWYERNKKTQIAWNNRRKKELKDKLDEYRKTCKCKRCGEDHPACLDFHHIDPETKEGGMGWLISRRGFSWNRVLEEIGKCEVLCSNCHRKLHWEEVGSIGNPLCPVETRFSSTE
tara:strand:+ start:633 stop:1019 length:387 start_codon:yes stop_codon:yes gene_type:complete